MNRQGNDLMAQNFQGFFFKLARAIVRPFYPVKEVLHAERALSPACYVVHYQNSKGPILSMAYMPVEVHPWALHVFCDRKSCYQQYMDYTFTVRFGWPKWLAAPVCFVLSNIISPLYRSMGCIPVYRGSMKIRETLNLSLEALYAGQSIIIFPDVAYQSDSAETGEIYQGFLNLEKFYYKKTGAHLPFVPVYCKSVEKTLEIGEPLYFEGALPFVQEKQEMAQRLVAAMNRTREEPIS